MRRLILLLMIAGFAGCTTLVKSSKDIQSGHVLVIGKVYSETHAGFRDYLWTAFARFIPHSDSLVAFALKGDDGEVFAANDGLPGEYHFSNFSNHYASYIYEPHNPRYEITLREGEAVYIGTIVVLHDGRRFRIDVRNEAEAAEAYFQQNFSDSGLKFTTRLMRRVYLNPVLPK